MKILHTSDWHLGRSFHGHSTVPQLREVLGAIPAIVRDLGVDVVVVAGDVFDHAAPAAALYELLAEVIRGIREAGAQVVLTSGNHDNAIRLGFQSEWAALGGVHVITRPDAFRTPLELADAYGTVDVYGIPYLEPMLQSGLYPGERHTEHAALLTRVMGEIAELKARRGHRSIVISHCFAQGARHTTAEPVDTEQRRELAEEPGMGLQWDLTAGGVDVVPAHIFEGHEYVALGHLHGRVTLAPTIRYSGAPIHFSFGESAKPRGAWLVTLGAAKDGAVTEWVDFPVPRPLARLRGTLEQLLEDPALSAHESSWVEATLTDRTRPIDPMRRLRDRFPLCARIELAPEGVPLSQTRTYSSRVRGKSDTEVIDEFLSHVRAGESADDEERHIISGVIAEVRSERPSVERDS